MSDKRAALLASLNGFTDRVMLQIDGKLDADQPSISSAKLTVPRNISTSGAATGTVSFDGSADVNIVLALSNSGVTAGTYGSADLIPVPVINNKGLVTGISTIGINKSVRHYADFASLPLTGETNKLYLVKNGAATVLYEWNGSGYSVITPNSDVANEAAKLTTARAITISGAASGSANFDGSAGVNIGITLADSGVGAGTHTKVTVNSKGIVTAGAALTAGDIPQLNQSTTGNAATASKLLLARSFDLTGDAVASFSFDGTANVATTITLANSGVTAGTYPKVTVNAKGLVTAGAPLLAGDIPTLNQNTTGNAATATKLVSAKTLSLTGDGTASMAFDGSANATSVLTLADSGVTAGNATKVTVDAKGRITDILPLLAGDIPTLNQSTTGNAATATQLATARTLSLSGDVTGSVSFNGSANVNTVVTLANSGVVAGTYLKVSVNSKGLVTEGGAITAGDIPTLNQSTTGNAATATQLATSRTINGVAFNGTANIVIADATKIPLTAINAPNGVAGLDASGFINSSALPSVIDEVIEVANFISLPVTGLISKIYVTIDNNKTYRWSGSAYQPVGNGSVDSVAGRTGVVTLTKADVGLTNVDNTADSAKNVLSAATLTTSRTLSLTGDATGSMSFNGSANASAAITLANSGVTAGSYAKVTVDAKGRVTSGGSLVAADIPVLDASKITTGVLADSRLSGTYTGVSIDGSSGTAAKWTTARTITVTGDSTGSVALDGSANVSLALTLGTSGVTAGTYPKVTVNAKGLVTAGAALVAGDIPTLNQSTTGNAATATKLATARTLSVTGDATGSTSFDGSGNVSTALTLAASGVVAGSYAKVTVNTKGLVTGSSALVAADIPNLDAAKITSGTIADARLTGSYTGFVNLTGSGVADFAKFYGNAADTVAAPSFSWTGDTDTGIYRPAAGQVGIAIDGVQRALISSAGIGGVGTNLTALNASNLSTGTLADGRLTGSYTGVSIDGNSGTATRLATSRTLSLTGDLTGSAAFDGSANAAIGVTLPNTGVTAGTYPKVTVDAKGRVTAGTALLAGDIPTLNQNTTGTAAVASNAVKLQTARTLSISGDGTGSVAFDGSANAAIALTLGTVPVAKGGTGGTTQATGRAGLGIGSNATRDVTISTAAPSGGVDGDIWLQYI